MKGDTFLRQLDIRRIAHKICCIGMFIGTFALIPIWMPALLYGQSGTETAQGTIVSTATWVRHDQQKIVKAKFHELLSNKQRSMINSGFPTYSSLSVAILNPGETSISEPEVVRRAVYQIDCSVTFDTWEERYDVERLTGQVGHQEMKSFENYSEECLTGYIADSANTDKLADGGLLVATLVVKQTSPEETIKIKAWLVRQQSGLMQGLFSHMLGELALNAKANVIVRVPAISSLKKAGG